MVALTDLVFPGFFRPRTLEMGSYFGIYDGSRLAAMAGERMRLDGYQELSAVCTHPDYTGRGYAQRLLGDALQLRLRPRLHAVPARLRGQRARDRRLPQDGLRRPHRAAVLGAAPVNRDRDRAARAASSSPRTTRTSCCACVNEPSFLRYIGDRGVRDARADAPSTSRTVRSPATRATATACMRVVRKADGDGARHVRRAEARHAAGPGHRLLLLPGVLVAGLRARVRAAP